MRRLIPLVTMVSIAVAGMAVPAQAASTKVFNSLPAQLPGNVASVGFEATQTDAIGDQDPFGAGQAEAREGQDRDELVGV